MISPVLFLETLTSLDVDFYAGVPDSLLKELCACINDRLPSEKHIITHNEGGALALAAGYQVSTGKIPAVYLQNSGLGNMVNPLLSLMDKEVYSIPCLVIVGWRGEPGVKDEPQHVKQGKVQVALIESMGYKSEIIGPKTMDWKEKLGSLLEYSKDASEPVFVVIQKDTFENYESKNSQINLNYELSREEAIETVINELKAQDLVVSSTGKISRELYETRKKANSTAGDFLTVGCMGHASMIALGVRNSVDEIRKVVCLDGDGAFLMHMGAAAIIARNSKKNFIHVVLNNGCHESVGGQPTVGFEVSLTEVAKACGYSRIGLVTTKNEIHEFFREDFSQQVAFLEIRINSSSRANLGRPVDSALSNKKKFENQIGNKG